GFTSTDASVLKVGGSLSIGPDSQGVYNFGASVLTVGGDLMQGAGGSLYNGASTTDDATLTVGGNVGLAAGGFLYDYGTSVLTVTGDLTMGAGSYFADYGVMSVSGVFDPGSGVAGSNDQVGGVFNAEPGSSVTTDAATWEVLAGGSLNVEKGAALNVPSGGELLVDSGGSAGVQGALTVENGDLDVFGALSAPLGSVLVVEQGGQLRLENGAQASVDGTLLEWANPADINTITPLGSNQLDAVAQTMVGGSLVALPGVFTYTPASGTELAAGPHQALNVVFKPNDAAYAGAAATVFINVLSGPLTPTLTLNPVNITYGTALANGQLSGTAVVTINNQTVDVAGVFSYTSVAGAVLNAGAGQSEAVTFTPFDTTDYTVAYGTAIVNVAKANQTITVTQAAPGSAVYGTSFSVAAVSSSGLPVSIGVSGAGALGSGGSGSAVVLMTSGTGLAVVTFTQAGDANHNPAAVVVEDVTAQKANQTITVTQQLPGSAVYGGSFTVAAVSSSGLPVSIAASGAGSGAGSGSASIHMTSGTGTAVVTFSQAGDANHNPAAGVVEDVTAQKATPTVAWNNPAPIPYFTPLGGAQLDATANVSGTFVYAPAAGTLLSAGTHTLSATFTPTDGADYSSATATVQVVVLGPGVTVVGSQLYYVAGSKSGCDQLQIDPVGASGTGSTGVKVNGVAYKQAFTTISIYLQNGNADVRMARSLTINAVVGGGNGNDDIRLGAGRNSVTLGNGNDNVWLGKSSGDTVTLGNGNDNVWLGDGSGDSVTLGNGNDDVRIGKGSDQVVVLGNGNDDVWLGAGSEDSVTLGKGRGDVRIGDGSDNTVTVPAAGKRRDHIRFGRGSNNTIK
ncbi:MAG TPA: hypothetical protein VMS17_08015, partial [Gemmataceae bacterium]|nr:hypothetical protein [Gemmataceae bacterium]